jgi:hypothetical protein
MAAILPALFASALVAFVFSVLFYFMSQIDWSS